MTELEKIRAALARLPDPVALLASLFSRSPVGFQIYDAGGKSLLVNHAFIDLFGSEPPPEYNVLEDEIAAQHGVLDLIHRAFAGETGSTPTVWYDPRELTRVKVERGNRVAMQATFFPLFDSEGKVSHVGVVFKDLTAEMVQRGQLEEERELLAAIVDQVSEGIVMADQSGILRLVNRAARELGVRTGVSVPEEALLARALHGERGSELVETRAPDGTVRALAGVAVPLRRPDGAQRGAVVTFRDETERHKHEEEARMTGHFRERFIGILGHDLRTPLTAIGASAGLLLRRRDLPADAIAVARRISGSAERMGRMISDLLDFTQARLGGGIQVVRKSCDLREVARATVDEVMAASPPCPISLDVQGNTSGNFDPDRAAQLLSNLLQNAVQYCVPGEPVEVLLRGTDGHVEITVSNSGATIPSEESAVLFDPFRRGAGASARKGLGLGLYIVQQIARAHGGDATVESANGRTIFRAQLQR
jgi:signal transduction histidine kinase